MHTRINDQGELVVEAENELEFYALGCWYEKHTDFCSRDEANGEEGKDLIISLAYTDGTPIEKLRKDT